MNWVTQGPIADRTLEALGTTDRGVTVYRNMLRRELKHVEAGGDPMNVFRDNEPETMVLPLERVRGQTDQDAGASAIKAMFTRHEMRFCPRGAEIVEVFAKRQREPAAV